MQGPEVKGAGQGQTGVHGKELSAGPTILKRKKWPTLPEAPSLAQCHRL